MDIDEESAFNDASVAQQPSPEGFGESTQAGPSSVTVETAVPMSKNAMKKAAKQAKLDALKPLKRAAEKERRRIRSAQLSEGYANGTLSSEDKELFERRKKVEKERKAARLRERAEREGEIRDGVTELPMWKGGVVVDLGFDELMSDQEISSMSQQLGYLYSTNRTAPQPFSTILHTSFSPLVSPRLWEKMTKVGWDKWSKCFWWEQDIDIVHEQLQSGSSARSQSGDNRAKGLTGPILPPGLNNGAGHKLIYLSADAEDELDVLKEDEIYIIGGIVDRNRYKNLCQDKAEKLGIHTARLPIGSYLANLPTRKVLTVNQVFDILVKWVEKRDWAEAFEAVIPQRKYHTGKKEMRAAKSANKQGEVTAKVEGDTDSIAEDVAESEVDEEAAVNA